jgi:hypothetical protein
MDDDLLPDEEPADGEGPAEEHWERPVDRFRRTAAGSVLAAGMLGLADALEGRPERERPAIMSEAGEPSRRDPVELVLDPDHPERSVVYLRRPADPGADPPAGS